MLEIALEIIDQRITEHKEQLAKELARGESGRGHRAWIAYLEIERCRWVELLG
jgi:hypothetical protein